MDPSRRVKKNFARWSVCGSGDLYMILNTYHRPYQKMIEWLFSCVPDFYRARLC